MLKRPPPSPLGPSGTGARLTRAQGSQGLNVKQMCVQAGPQPASAFAREAEKGARRWEQVKGRNAGGGAGGVASLAGNVYTKRPLCTVLRMIRPSKSRSDFKSPIFCSIETIIRPTVSHRSSHEPQSLRKMFDTRENVILSSSRGAEAAVKSRPAVPLSGTLRQSSPVMPFVFCVALKLSITLPSPSCSPSR